jgi:CxxC motif-containing protein (DUF1111 family)
VLLLGLGFAGTGGPVAGDSTSGAQPGSLSAGKELFTREWLHGDKRSYAGSGLGPVFNARSCVTCHHQGGAGGAGPRHDNVILVSAFVKVEIFDGHTETSGIPPHEKIPANQELQRTKPVKQPDRVKLAEIHPALRAGNSFPLHRYGTDPNYTRWKMRPFGITADNSVTQRHAEQAIQINSGSMVTIVTGLDSGTTRDIDGVSVELIPAQRNTPALFGSGLIERISDRVLEQVAVEQRQAAQAQLQGNAAAECDSKGPAELLEDDEAQPVIGRVARLPDGRIGRFGWKSQVATLREFTLQACSSELGLEVPGFPRAMPPWPHKAKRPGVDLSPKQCDQLVLFVASLPPPIRRAPETVQHAAEIAAGHRLFTGIGCAACHRPRLGDVEGIYSDLLLHDMGQQLNDSGSYGVITSEGDSTAKPAALPIRKILDEASGKQEPPRFGASAREWRTPPLWGLRDSGPYLHDGRADTVAAAVAFHGGEALSASRAFCRLSPREREQIELFLQSLAAPALLP